MNTYSIKEIERLTDIKAHTIRIWEQRYNLLEPLRTDTNIRYYTNEHLKKILNVNSLYKAGYKISKIAELSEEQLKDKIASLQSNNNFETIIAEFVKVTIDFDEESFNKLFSDCINKYGIETSIIDILYPFLDKIGVLWQTDKIHPAQEHFISNLIRQKIIANTDSLKTKVSKAETFLLFLPEGELHEISLLFYNYILKKNGYKVIYLGQSVPLKDLVKVIEYCKPDNIIMYSINHDVKERIPHYIKKIATFSFVKKLFVKTSYDIGKQSNITPFSSISDFL